MSRHGTASPAGRGRPPPLTVACHEPTGQRGPSTALLAPGHLPTCQVLEHVERPLAVRGTPLRRVALACGARHRWGALRERPGAAALAFHQHAQGLADGGASLLGTALSAGRHPRAVEHTIYPRTVGIVGGGEEPMAREGGLEEDAVRPARGCWWGACRGGSARSGYRGGGLAAAACTFVVGRVGTPRYALDSHPWGHPRRAWDGGFVTTRHGAVVRPCGGGGTGQHRGWVAHCGRRAGWLVLVPHSEDAGCPRLGTSLVRAQRVGRQELKQRTQTRLQAAIRTRGWALLDRCATQRKVTTGAHHWGAARIGQERRPRRPSTSAVAAGHARRRRPWLCASQRPRQRLQRHGQTGVPRQPWMVTYKDNSR